jgi:thiamine transport system substrate-binding protein
MRIRSLMIPFIIVICMAACAPAATPSPTPSPTPAGETTIATRATSTEEPTPEPSAPTDTASPQPEIRILRVMTHDSFSISEEVVAAFENENQARVQFLEAGDTGVALNKAILAKDDPLADVFYGVDNTFLSRALREDIFTPYESPLLEVIPDRFELDDQHRALPVDFGDVCLNYDKAYLEDRGVAPPESLEDLLDPAYQGLTVVENPATSSPGLAFLLATIGHFGEDGYLDFWADLAANDVAVTNDWNTAYYTEFTRAGGTHPIVVSYGSSPPAEVYFSEEPLEESPTAAVVAPETCFRQIELVGILRGGQNLDLAQAWVDYMLAPRFQEDMPLNMFVFPVNADAQLPDVFAEHAEIPEVTAEVSPEQIDENREAWIQAWTEIVVR